MGSARRAEARAAAAKAQDAKCTSLLDQIEKELSALEAKMKLLEE